MLRVRLKTDVGERVQCSELRLYRVEGLDGLLGFGGFADEGFRVSRPIDSRHRHDED